MRETPSGKDQILSTLHVFLLCFGIILSLIGLAGIFLLGINFKQHDAIAALIALGVGIPAMLYGAKKL